MSVTIVSRLQHENIVKLVDFLRFEEENTMILLYEFLELIPLNVFLQSISQIRWNLKFYQRIALQILKAVCFCHSQNVIHGDLNMHNILIAPDTNQIKIIDFGCAKIVSPTGDLYSPAGHPKYRPPKQEFFSVSPFEAECWQVGLILLGLLLQTKVNTRKAMNFIKNQWENIQENEGIHQGFFQVVKGLLAVEKNKDKISIEKALEIVEKLSS